jgi:SAM-dependent methyltransferase
VEVTLIPTRCPICGESARSTELYPANLHDADFNPDVFSQRRPPDRIHYRMVRCSTCGLVRSDPAADASSLESLYRESGSFDGEEGNLRGTYGRYLRRLDAFGGRGGKLLEVGSGTGFFLLEAEQAGYDVTGVEPSRAAAAGADPAVAARIVNDVMRPGLFDPETFDVVCLFQVFDHVSDPNHLLAECARVLRPGGLALAVNHDVEALTNRLMRERSPIVDVEHTFLYSLETMRAIFERNSFELVERGRVWNDYSLNYLARLAPLPSTVKTPLLAVLAATVGRLRLRVPLGNLYVVCRKPLSSTGERAA